MADHVHRRVSGQGEGKELLVDSPFGLRILGRDREGYQTKSDLRAATSRSVKKNQLQTWSHTRLRVSSFL